MDEETIRQLEKFILHPDKPTLIDNLDPLSWLKHYLKASLLIRSQDFGDSLAISISELQKHNQDKARSLKLRQLLTQLSLEKSPETQKGITRQLVGAASMMPSFDYYPPEMARQETKSTRPSVL